MYDPCKLAGSGTAEQDLLQQHNPSGPCFPPTSSPGMPDGPMCLKGLSTTMRSSGLQVGIVLMAVARPSVAAFTARGVLPPKLPLPDLALPREIG